MTGPPSTTGSNWHDEAPRSGRAPVSLSRRRHGGPSPPGGRVRAGRDPSTPSARRGPSIEDPAHIENRVGGGGDRRGRRTGRGVRAGRASKPDAKPDSKGQPSDR